MQHNVCRVGFDTVVAGHAVAQVAEDGDEFGVRCARVVYIADAGTLQRPGQYLVSAIADTLSAHNLAQRFAVCNTVLHQLRCNLPIKCFDAGGEAIWCVQQE